GVGLAIVAALGTLASDPSLATKMAGPQSLRRCMGQVQAKGGATMKSTAVLAAAVALVASAASGQAPPDYDFDWVTVGAPGNRPTTPDETPWWGDRPLGAVDYKFRIATKEVTVDQWFEFVKAYAPYHEGTPDTPRFLGRSVRWTGVPGEYTIVPGTGQFATRASFHYAARYVNWLHNGKGTEREAFESGVY